MILLCAALLLSSCRSEPAETSDPAGNDAAPVYTEEQLAADLGIEVSFPYSFEMDWNESQEEEKTPSGAAPVPVTPAGSEPDTAPENDSEDSPSGTMADRYRTEDGYRMKVYGQMEVYSSTDAKSPQTILTDGEIVTIRETGGEWFEVTFDSSPYSGYARSGEANVIGEKLEVYAELPVEYGMARTNAGDYVPAYSRLVDVRKYFRVFSSTAELSRVADFSQYDLVVSMKLSTSETTIGEPFYSSNIAMVQYDLIPMIRKAVELFEKDGYRIVIYDAYRPTSVQQRWFDVVRVHKWVADPSIGMGGVHDRGTALDISLIDMDGNLLEMPTPMHTFTEESARNSPTMTQTARDNMNYMLNIMTECGFTYINSEWWHFQDVDTKYYLPTDHPIDSIPLVPAEATEIQTVTGP